MRASEQKAHILEQIRVLPRDEPTHVLSQRRVRTRGLGSYLFQARRVDDGCGDATVLGRWLVIPSRSEKKNGVVIGGMDRHAGRDRTFRAFGVALGHSGVADYDARAVRES